MKISLLLRHTLMVEDGAFSHKIDYVTIYKKILNLEGHTNRTTGSRVTAFLLNGWILPIVGASAVEGLRSTELPRLVATNLENLTVTKLKNSSCDINQRLKLQ